MTPAEHAALVERGDSLDVAWVVVGAIGLVVLARLVYYSLRRIIEDFEELGP